MKEKHIVEAKHECIRFLNKVESYLTKLDENSMAHFGCKESGAMKRSSMDLTRALSKMRNELN